VAPTSGTAAGKESIVFHLNSKKAKVTSKPKARMCAHYSRARLGFRGSVKQVLVTALLRVTFLIL
jgi:hypothetical protein